MSKLLLLSWVIANSVKNKADVRFVIIGMMMGMFFQALIGTSQGASGRPVGLDFLSETAEMHRQKLSVGLANRVQGTMTHPNAYATYIVTVLPFTLALLFSKIKHFFKAMAGIIFCVGFIALVFTLSRSAWINSLVITSIGLVLAVRHKRISSKAAIWIAGATSLVVPP